MSSTAPSLKVVKTFQYRGATKAWSNRYHFSGSTPVDSGHWTTLADAVTAAEKAVLHASITITEAVGYAPGSEIPVFTKSYALAGTFSIGSAPRSSGDSAVMVRYATGSRTAKNHPLYLYSWYHGCAGTSSSDGDTVLPALVTAHQTYASSWVTGFSDGSSARARTGPKGDLATGYLVDSKVRHRDFPTA